MLYSFFRIKEIFTDLGDLGSDMVTLLMKQDTMSETRQFYNSETMLATAVVTELPLSSGSHSSTCQQWF